MKTKPALAAATLAAVAIFTIALAPHARAVGAFVEIKTGPGVDDRIEGEAIDVAHEGWIDVLAIATSAVRTSADGDRKRAPAPGDFVIIKEIDKASPKLQQALFTGQVFEKLTIKYPLESMHPGLIIRLAKAYISDFRVDHHVKRKNARPLEQISLGYTEIEWSYSTPDPGGEITLKSAFIFDLSYGTNDPEQDSDGDTITNDLDPDDDNDGIDDAYELANGLHPLVDDADFDDDGDGDSNYQEWLAGTRANDADSKFGIYSISLDAKGAAHLNVLTIPNRRYVARASFDLSKGSWAEVRRFDTPQDGKPVVSQLSIPQAVAASLGNLYFRVDVMLVPEG